MAVWDWVTTAADNDDADAAINWAEGQAPSTVNDSARSMMARISHWLNTLSGNVTMGGASNAYTLTTGESLSAYPSNFRVLWQPNADSTGAVTLNVDGIGAKKVYMPDGTQAGNGDLDADSMYDVAYDGALDSASGGFKIIGFPDTTLTAADYLTAANNLSDLASASTARSNLGLGTMAVETASNYLTTATAASTYAALAGAAFTGSVTMAADLAVDTDTLFVDVSTDRVGIGTASPATTLHVSGPIRTDGATAGLQMSPRDGSGTTFQWYNPTGDDVRLYGATDILTATTAGNVGIGTTSPSVELHVDGEIQGRAAHNSSVSGTLVQADHLEGHVNYMSGNVTIPNATAGCHCVLLNNSSASRTITRGGTNMFIGGDATNQSSVTIGPRGVVGVVYGASSIIYLSGNVS